MNCQIGDHAVIIRSAIGNVGAIVYVDDHSPLKMKDGSKIWRCIAMQTVKARMLLGTVIRPLPPGSAVHLEDAQLRPLRDTDGQDETLTWKETPSPVTS